MEDRALGCLSGSIKSLAAFMPSAEWLGKAGKFTTDTY
jgi:hypothetical protein